MQHKPRILIAGGGIGGLCAALCLKRIGADVVVLEASAQLAPLGVGINVLPHAVAVLEDLGLLPQMHAMGVETSAVVFANRFGQSIYRDARGTAGAYSHPQFSVHRGHFQQMLWQQAVQSMGEGALRLGCRLASFETSSHSVLARFDRTNARPLLLEADLLIAADGIHSAARKQLYPQEGGPRWNGMMMWRGTSRTRPFLDGRTMLQMGNRMAKFVAYAIQPPSPDGLQLVNWICDRRLHEDGIGGGLAAPSREDWSKPGSLQDLLPTFDSWQFEDLRVTELLQQALQIFEWPMVDRDPLPQWTHGRVTLLGDAAHPMYPIGSNGATQAIMDAASLARHLSGNVEPDLALQAYEAERRPLCAKLVQMNRQEGLDSILDWVEARAPNGFRQLQDVIDPQEIDDHVRAYKQAAGHQQYMGKA